MTPSDIQVGTVNGNAVITQVGGDIHGDVFAGDKIVIQQIIQQARQIVTAPYKFLASYDISDRDIFFGREAVIEELVGKLPRYKTLVINGCSGSGKTSLIYAGLIPRLAENGYQFISFNDYSDPMRQLRDYVAQNALFKAYAEQTTSLVRFLKAVTRSQPPQHLVLIFDQFERFFVNVPSAARLQFIHEIKACLDSDLSGAELDVVFAQREDFFGQFAREFGAIIPTFIKETDLFNLLPLSRAEARTAILNPLERIALKIGYDETFVDEVLLPGLMGEHVGGVAIDPPHLQIVCNQLYEEVQKRAAAKLARGGVVEIDRALYDDLHGTTGILQNYLDDRIANIVPQMSGGQAVLRSILKTMVETTGTRKFVALREAQHDLADVAPAVVADGLRLLREERIIEMRGEDETASYSLSHEVMVAKVQEWFDERELERKKAEETLERGLKEWASSQTLLRENQVQHIRRWARPDDLTARAEELLTTSQRAYEEQQRKEAEQERRIKRNRTAFQMALGIGLVIALMLSALAFWQRNLAVKEQQRAEEQTRIAETQTQTAEEQRQQAVKQKKLALEAISSLTYELADELVKLPRAAPIVARILESNIALLDRIYALDADTPDAQREKASNLSRNGNIWLVLGNTDKALSAYQQSSEILQRLAAADPANTEAQRDLSISYSRLGDIQLQRGDTDAALSAYQQYLEINKQLAEADPANTEAQRGLSLSYGKLGEVQLQLGDTQAALDMYQKYSEIARRLAAADPANTQAQRDLWVSFYKLGRIEEESSQPQKALEWYQQALPIAERLAEDRANAQAQNDLKWLQDAIKRVQDAAGEE